MNWTTIDNLRAYVDAQVQYASDDRDGDDVLEYAQKINSTAGKKDGLYWEIAAGSDEELSPFGPFFGEHAAYLTPARSDRSVHGVLLQDCFAPRRECAGRTL